MQTARYMYNSCVILQSNELKAAEAQAPVYLYGNLLELIVSNKQWLFVYI